jgi:hypothetical protein
MTSSSKKKKDKKKDFQVSEIPKLHDGGRDLTLLKETQVEGWKDETKGCKQYRHQLQSQM